MFELINMAMTSRESMYTRGVRGPYAQGRPDRSHMRHWDARGSDTRKKHPGRMHRCTMAGMVPGYVFHYRVMATTIHVPEISSFDDPTHLVAVVGETAIFAVFVTKNALWIQQRYDEHGAESTSAPRRLGTDPYDIRHVHTTAAHGDLVAIMNPRLACACVSIYHVDGTPVWQKEMDVGIHTMCFDLHRIAWCAGDDVVCTTYQAQDLADAMGGLDIGGGVSDVMFRCESSHTIGFWGDTVAVLTEGEAWSAMTDTGPIESLPSRGCVPGVKIVYEPKKPPRTEQLAWDKPIPKEPEFKIEKKGKATVHVQSPYTERFIDMVTKGPIMVILTNARVLITRDAGAVWTTTHLSPAAAAIRPDDIVVLDTVGAVWTGVNILEKRVKYDGPPIVYGSEGSTRMIVRENTVFTGCPVTGVVWKIE